MGIKATAQSARADNIPQQQQQQHSTGTGRLSKWLLGGPTPSAAAAAALLLFFLTRAPDSLVLPLHSLSLVRHSQLLAWFCIHIYI